MEERNQQIITFRVQGMNPAPQGSKKHVGNGIMIESCKRVKPWRELVASAAIENNVSLFRGAVNTSFVFLLTRPANHFKNGAIKILDTSIVSATSRCAPAHHAIKPDISKLIRSTEDALSKLVFEDDCRIVNTTAQKRWCVGNEYPGAIITIISLN